MKPGLSLEVALTALDDHGAGVAEIDRDRVHVAGALPGERALVSVAHLSSHRTAGVRDVWATLDQVTLASPDRVPPACPAFGQCGGCVLQALAYKAQVAWKGRRLAESIARSGLTVTVAPCVPSPQSLHYRNQAKYIYGRTAAGKPTLGAYAPRSHRIVDLAGCQLLESPLDPSAAILRDLLEAFAVPVYDEHRRTGQLRHAILRCNHLGQILVTLVVARTPWPMGAELAAEVMRRAPAVVGVVLNLNDRTSNVIFGTDEQVLAGQGSIDDRIGDTTLRLSSRSFFQVNRHVAALIYAAIEAELARLGPVGRAIDVYAGAGGIALTLAPQAEETIAVEENASAATDARKSAERLGRTNVQVMTGDAATLLAELAAADVVVLNPPRAGCAPAVLDAAARMRPRLLAYVSCNATTLARDLRALAARGMRVVNVAPFDMLPHTPHVEALAILAPA